MTLTLKEQPKPIPFLEQLKDQIIRDYEMAKVLESDTCDKCLNGHSRKYRCPNCNDIDYCETHVAQHISHLHHEEKVYDNVRILKIRQLMRMGIVSAFFTPEQTITVSDKHPMTYHSVWFKEAEHHGFSKPAILVFNPPRVLDPKLRPQAEQDLVQSAKRLLKTLNLQAYAWSSNEHITLYTAIRTGVQFMPGDIATPDQEDTQSGAWIKPNTPPGTINKRNRIRSISEGAVFNPEPSHYPEFRVTDDFTLKVGCYDSDTAGDGTGVIRQTAAMKLIRASGASTKGNKIALQIVAQAADYAYKGLFAILPDHRFPYPDVDIMVDSESFNSNVLNTKHTMLKLTVYRHKPNKRYIWMEPLELMLQTASFIDPKEINKVAENLAKQLDLYQWKEARASQRIAQLQEELDIPKNPAEAGTHLERSFISNSNNPSIQMYLWSNSLYASPEVMKLMTGSLPNHWDTKRKNARELPGTFMSGAQAYLTYAPYLGYELPEPGYARLIWDPYDRFDDFAFLAVSPQDRKKWDDAFDTWDCDDALYFCFMQDEHGDPWILAYRLPNSVGGGAAFRLYPEDAERVRTLSDEHHPPYHFYKKTGNYRYPDLHTIVDGKPVVPYVLEPTPLSDPPKWTTKEDDALQSLLEISRYKGAIGRATNLLASLDYAGLYDPALHKANSSSAIIDPTLHATSDPEVDVIKPLIRSHLDFIYKGKPMETCIWPRVKNTLNRAHREQGGEGELQVDFTCPPWHNAVKATYLKAVKDLEQSLRTRQLVSNGPHYWALQTYPADLMDIVLQAHNARNAIWSAYSTNRNALKADEQLDHNQKEYAKGKLLENARKREQEATLNGWTKAKETVEDYVPGSFMGAWLQLALSTLKRFESERAKQQPVNLKALMCLPEEERHPFVTQGPVHPTMALRAIEQLPEGIAGTKAKIVQKAKTLALTDEEGTTLVHLAPRAEKYAGRTFTILGTIPDVDDPSNVWQQCRNLLVLQLH